ncbi:MAG: hypothetical protein LAN36_12925 [Acidobacteriia bacterium]|nr:hypothetical protein [Terriglobia bacterium]
MTRRTLEIAAFSAALLVAALAAHAWLASRDEQVRLASTLAAQKQLIDAADSRERSRQTTLDVTLAQIEKLKRAAQTPAQIVRDLPKYLPLPQPITLASTAPSAATRSEKGSTLQETSAASHVAQARPDEGNVAGPEASSSGSRIDWRESPSTVEGRGFIPAKNAGAIAPSDAQVLLQQVLVPPSCSPPDDCSAQIHAAQARLDAERLASREGLSSGGRTFGPKIEGRREAPSSAQNLSQQVAVPPSCDPPNNCSAQIPAGDLKPLYDFVQDCRACQAQLAAARQDKSDDAAKIVALIRERDAAITAAKGGSFWRRLRRNTMWFVVGAGVGAAGGYAATISAPPLTCNSPAHNPLGPHPPCSRFLLPARAKCAACIPDAHAEHFPLAFPK